MTVTVAIPVYDGASFVAETLNSVVNQTCSDLRIKVAVEPGDASAPHEPRASLAAIERFAGDPRLEVRVNSRRLGWVANINSLLSEVETEYFAILPHDDIWHPEYIETLQRELQTADASSVAYCDLRTFDDSRHPEGIRRSLPLTRTDDKFHQAAEFFLRGPLAMPWRGVIRTRISLQIRHMPLSDRFGLRTEDEYALALILAGPACHVPDTLYDKRMHSGERKSASQQRLLDAGPEIPELIDGYWQRFERRVDEALERQAADPLQRYMVKTSIWLRRQTQTASKNRQKPTEADIREVRDRRVRTRTLIETENLDPDEDRASADPTGNRECKSAATERSRRLDLARRVDGHLMSLEALLEANRGDLKSALSLSIDAFALCPEELRVALRSFDLLMRAGRRSEACAILEHAERIAPDDEALVRRREAIG